MNDVNRADPKAQQGEGGGAWLKRFWLEPTRSEPLALFRIFAALMLLDHVLFTVAGQPTIASPFVHRLIIAVWSLSLLALALGWRTRIAAIIGVGSALISAGPTEWMASVGDIPVQLSFYLALAPVGATWSLDALRHARAGYRDPVEGFDVANPRPYPGPTLIAPWSVRLLQLYLVGNYFLAALIVTGGASDPWFSGEVLFSALQHSGVARFSPDELSVPLGICQLLSVAALLWAVAMPALAFQRRSVPLMLGMGVFLHILSLVLFRAEWPGHLLLACYPLFLSGEAVSTAVASFSRTDSDTPYVVAYDTFCPLCRRSRLMLERMDLGRRLRFVDIHDRGSMEREFQGVSYAQCLEELQVKSPNATITGGYFAFRTLTRVLPALRPFRWVFFVPGVPQIGVWVYRWIAKHRYRLVDCSSEVCNLHVRALSQVSIDEHEIAAIVERARNAARNTPS